MQLNSGSAKTSSPLKDQLLKAQERAIHALTTQIKDGALAYKPGGTPSTEATAWCGIALANQKETASEVIKFLLKTQNKDGGWSTSPGAGKSDWTSSLGLLSLRILSQRDKSDQTTAAIKRAMSYLFDVRTEFYKPTARLLFLLFRGESSLHYARGWPWTVGCYHWVEPTSYAVLGLMLPRLPEHELYEKVLNTALQFLKENVCRTGGWNHGNHLSLGVYQPPYVVTTAEALMAMQFNPEHASIKKAFEYLDANRTENHSAMSLAWTLLARQVYGREIEEETKRLISAQHEDGSFGPNLMVTGLSLIAINAALGSNALKFTPSTI